MDCEHVYAAVQAVSQTALPAYDRIEVILTAVAVIVAVLGVMFTAASLVLALGAMRGWKELIREAREAAETAAKSEAKTWADIYSDPVKMFAALGVKPTTDALAPTQGPSPAPSPPPQVSASNKPIGEQLVEAISVAEPEQTNAEPPVVDAPLGKEEPDGVRAESPTEPGPESGSNERQE